MQEVGHESLNVVVDFQNDKLKKQKNVKTENIIQEAEKAVLSDYPSKPTTQRNEASDGEGEYMHIQGGHEVLGGSQKMEQEVSNFAHRYPENSAPEDSPKK